uniref:Ig-like domain-containing protein n=4 Tax=Sus scrofa TaxID=9823 RepID=A0A8W4FCP5_PIG
FIVSFILWGLVYIEQVFFIIKNILHGQSVTLECKFTVSFAYYIMYWYRQSSSREMTRIIDIYSQNRRNSEGRYSVEFYKESQTLKLTISSLTLSDSDVYFCAVREVHGDGSGRECLTKTPRAQHQTHCDDTDKLIFGKGTQLVVEPRSQPNSKPSVFVMKNGTNVACLVKDFYPKDIKISLESSKKITEYDPAIVVSPTGKYSAVKLGQYGDPDAVTCSVQHDQKTLHSADFEPKKNSSETPKPKESENVKQTSEICYEPQVQAWKVNMMSVTVLGFRMLFAKSVAVNFLLTAKLFFF